MNNQLIPKHDKILLKQVEEGEKMYGSIALPDLGHQGNFICEVVGVGPGRTSEFGFFIATTAQVGDMVVIPKIGATRLEYDGEEYFIIADKEILLTIGK